LRWKWNEMILKGIAVNNLKPLILLLISSLFFSGCGPQASPTAVEQANILAAPSPVLATPVSSVAPEIVSPQLTTIHFINSLEGWGLTESEVVRTNDGGVTWFDITPTGLTSTGYSVISDFFSATQAWVLAVDPNNFPLGGTLYRTEDGGQTWSNFSTPFSSGYLKFLDAHDGWMMADLGSGAGSMAVAVFQTKDGGANWTRTYTNDVNTEGSSDSLPLNGIKQLFVPLNFDTAWIGGVVYETGAVYLYRSDDGGENWAKVNLDIPAEASKGELSVVDVKLISATQGVLAIHLATTGAPEILLFFTNDGGNSWTLARERLAGIGKLEIPSAKEIVYYDGSQFQVSRDAANSFESVTPDQSFGEFIIDMSFVGAEIGWVVVANESDHYMLYKTTDSGATWSALIP